MDDDGDPAQIGIALLWHRSHAFADDAIEATHSSDIPPEGSSMTLQRASSDAVRVPERVRFCLASFLSVSDL